MVSLRLLFISVVLLIAVVSTAANVAAAEKVVKISKVSAVKNSEALVIVSLDSQNSQNSQRKNTGSKVTVSVPEVGLRASRNVDFAKTNKKTVHLEIPSPDMFDPYVRIVFSSDGGRRVKHRPLLLE